MRRPSSHPTLPVGERLEALARAALQECDPYRLACAEAAEIAAPWRASGAGLRGGRIVVVGAGKASARMASGVADAIGPAEVEGLVVGKGPRPTEVELGAIRYLAGSHPEADEQSRAAGDALRSTLARLGPDDLLIALLSGGASSLIACPMGGLVPGDLGLTSRALLAAAVPIGAINVVRRHLSATAGGRLAAETRARIEVLVLSDVLGNDLAAIGSGPFAPDESTFEDALTVVRDLPAIPLAVRRLLERGARGQEPETLRPGDPAFARVRHRLLASPETLLSRALALAPHHGFAAVVPSPPSGDRVELVAARLVRAGSRLAEGALLVTGGEPTVELPPGAGLGGRNQQLALHVARAIACRAGEPRVADRLQLLALASDGEDGPTDAAGARVDARSWARIAAANIDPARALERADAYPALDAIGALVRTGLTGTNVLDLHLVALEPRARDAPVRRPGPRALPRTRMSR